MSHIPDEEGGLSDALPPLDGGQGPARRISRQKSAALVQAALLAAFEEAPPPPRPARRRWPWVLVTGGALLVLGSAASVWWFSHREPASSASGGSPRARGGDTSAPSEGIRHGAGADADEGAPGPEARVGGSVSPARASAPTGSPAGQESVPRSSDAVEAVPGSVRGGAPRDAEDAEASTGIGARREGASRPSAEVSVARGAGSRGPVEAQVAPVATPAQVEDLMRLANTHRAAGEWKQAEAVYQRVIRAQPRAMSAYVARVASGSLRLEHLRDARGALRQFETALRTWPGGVLEQEARQGITEAHRVLGNAAEERQALEEFLSHHPDSPHAVAARARLREISGR
ncbi:tetratricopeptide repeat protein [Myxococcus sp. K15C18031901]|uniref:tetratricopeptide repeat protein n=1 Tax=Myxococcus dinghuensis TaxID=2906761 RepID=UPI0020A6F2E9|nr:tetratricopeptide repeat protein [Myxococcus dinghuensis]MCP3100581.1 tetratricopeptide repeat protein [Myxococcus dinghuensis]